MKKYLIIMVIVCIGLQPYSSICSEKEQTWGEWARSILYKPQVQKTLSGVTHATALGGASYLTTKKFPALEISSKSIPKFSISLPLVAGGLIFAYYIPYLAELLRSLKHYRNRIVEVAIAKEFLKFVIANELLFPTRSSKIHVLLKQDEFLQYVNYQYKDIVNEACNQLLKEIDIADYPIDQQTEDRKIDGYISKLKINIAHLPLETQIAELEKIVGQQKTIQEMKGYLSLYFRLQNKLEIEKGFTYKLKQHEIVPQMTPIQQRAFEMEISESAAKQMMHQEEFERLAKEKETKFIPPQENK